jgi:beta-mannanase
MNGNWYQWSVAANKYITTRDYIDMWRHVREMFDRHLNTTTDTATDDHLQGKVHYSNSSTYTDVAYRVTAVSVDVSTRVQWIWCPNNFDTGAVSAESYYPGNRYVDWLGLDVYNPGGGAASAAGLITPMMKRFHSLSPTKPVAIPEFGTGN